MTPIEQNISKLPWFRRRSNSVGYCVSLLIWFTIAFWVLMVIPYAYDQKNRTIFERAEKGNSLIIREFRDTFINSEIQRCNNLAGCNNAELFKQLSEKKIIALDYVSRLRDAQRLTFESFFRQTLLVFICSLILLFVIARLDSSLSRRFMLLLTLMVCGFSAVAWIGELPHKNVKFYFSVGLVYAILIPLMDYLHRVGSDVFAPRQCASNSHGVIEALKLAHRRWLGILAVAAGLLIVIVGTISFNVIDYQARTFGESFSYHPLLGVLIVALLGLSGFVWGVVRNLLSILEEIELCVAELSGNVSKDDTEAPQPSPGARSNEGESFAT